MILVGQYISPYVRRVAISLRLLGIDYEHDTRSVFRDFSSMRKTNPVGRIPSLILDDGEVLIDSSAILDWLDELVGPSRALISRSGPARRRTLRVMALAAGVMDKSIASAYERLVRPEERRWSDWIARLRKQQEGGLEALDGESWPTEGALDQGQITTACMYRYACAADTTLFPRGRYPKLESLSERCEQMAAFKATAPAALPYNTEMPVAPPS